ncbi:hypothetical protein CKO_03856 [Citrobacter koseri ATCC BAA-895]|uniref:Uncharacterized protein n=1 Tax=Citrobacter koseri (strain ATCC BAA-895 / CDC 4225-83 / SGSC4696) TaxID=290338 RepID=A8AN70_CITK8|nr:hypothetical protein CKO_03856 [Citrobacter koseri ATCC BAA-895]
MPLAFEFLIKRIAKIIRVAGQKRSGVFEQRRRCSRRDKRAQSTHLRRE